MTARTLVQWVALNPGTACLVFTGTIVAMASAWLYVINRGEY